MLTWAAAWTNAKIVTNEPYNLSEFDLLFLRFLLGTISLIPFILNKNLFQIFNTKKNITYIFSVSVLFFLYNIFFFLGTKIVAGEGSVLVTTINPIITVIIMSVINKNIFKNQIIGIIFGFIGGLTIMEIWNGYTKLIDNPYYLYFLICALTWGTISVLTKYAQKNINPIVFIFSCYFLVTLFSIPFIEIQNIINLKLDSTFILNFLMLSIGAMSFGTSIYMYSTSIIGPVQSSVFIFTVPAISVLISALTFPEESPTMPIIVGGMLSLIGVIIVNYKKTP